MRLRWIVEKLLRQKVLTVELPSGKKIRFPLKELTSIPREKTLIYGLKQRLTDSTAYPPNDSEDEMTERMQQTWKRILSGE